MAIKKKTTYFTCNSCSGKFVTGSGIAPPTNKHKWKTICTKCYKKHFTSISPMPAISSNILKNTYGSMLTYGGGILSGNGGGLLNKANLVGHDGSSLVGHDGSSLVGHDGSSLIGQDGSTFRRR